MDWENHLKKILSKKLKIKVKLPHVNKKANFCSNTVFSLHFKFRAKKFHAAKPLAFSLFFLFRRDQNHYSNLTSKIMKMCEQIFKKKTAPQYNSKCLNCKKRKKRRPIIASVIALRLQKKRKLDLRVRKSF